MQPNYKQSVLRQNYPSLSEQSHVYAHNVMTTLYLFHSNTFSPRNYETNTRLCWNILLKYYDSYKTNLVQSLF